MHGDIANIMYVNVILERSFNSESPRYFALCESCFWCASLLKSGKVVCPVCAAEEISLIPLGKDESYYVNYGPRSGLDVSFSVCKR